MQRPDRHRAQGGASCGQGRSIPVADPQRRGDAPSLETQMRIAQVAPPFESVPPTRYGGTERVVSLLTEELVRRGHHVTLFASGDSQTSAGLVPCCERGLRLDPD